MYIVLTAILFNLILMMFWGDMQRDTAWSTLGQKKTEKQVNSKWLLVVKFWTKKITYLYDAEVFLSNWNSGDKLNTHRV